MAYLALARKYRPQRFADMIGQEHVTRTLENAIKSDRVHHAYLFCGVRGLGKTTAARILAKALVCERGPTPEPCNQCSQCVAINEGRSVDVIEIDGASNNSVEDIRSLRDQVNYLPQSARRKIYIIDEVHMLSTAAFNALLKTLEEPPPHVTFMSATTDPHKVLPTILSRVSRLDYRRVRAATLVPYLEWILQQEGFSVEREGLHVIARCGEGSVRDSLTLLDKVIAFAQDPAAITTAEVLTVLGQASRYTVGELVQAVLDGDAAAVLARFEDMTATGSDLMQLAVAILQHLRDLAVVKLTGSRAALLDMDDDLYEQLVRQAESVDAELVAQHFDRFARTVDSLDNSRVPRLVIEMGLLELVNAEPLVPLGDLVARLDALASGRSPGGGPRGGGGGSRGAPRGGGRSLRAQPESPPTPARFEQRAPAAPARSEQRTPPTAPARFEQAPAAPPTRAASPPAPEPEPSPAPAHAHAHAPEPPRSAPPTPAGHSEEERHIQMLEQLARDAGLLPGSGPAKPAPPQPRAQPRAEARPEPRPHPEPPEVRPKAGPEARPKAGPEARGPRPVEARQHRSTSGPAPGYGDPRPEPAPEPGSQDFSLTNEDLGPSKGAGDPDAGCPSSRCVPREGIPWRTLHPWDAWESFLDRIREENDLLWAVLLDLGLVSLSEGTVELASPAAGFAQTQLRENPELKTAFEHFTAEYFGEAMHLELIDATPSLPDAPSLALVDAERRRRHREAIEADAEHNPRIRSLLRTFGGQLQSIEPLEGPALPPVGQRGLPG